MRRDFQKFRRLALTGPPPKFLEISAFAVARWPFGHLAQRTRIWLAKAASQRSPNPRLASCVGRLWGFRERRGARPPSGDYIWLPVPSPTFGGLP